MITPLLSREMVAKMFLVPSFFFISKVARRQLPGAGECEVIAFPYRRNGEIINVKYRALAEGGELRFWNLDAVLGAASERVYIVEKAKSMPWRPRSSACRTGLPSGRSRSPKSWTATATSMPGSKRA